MPYLRQAKRVFEKVWDLSYLFSESCFTRKSSGRFEIQLVVLDAG